MKTYTIVSRKALEEDRIAICPIFGCESLTRVKPLKFGFLGFGKYPKCKEHKKPLVYIDERIGDFVDAALSCLFDVSSLPSKNLLSVIWDEIPEELDAFIKLWISCITIGRGASIISRYMDSISNSYLKHLSKKQIKSISNSDKTKRNNYQTIKNGLQEVTNQYTRLLKHLRIHHEIFNFTKKIKPFSNSIRNILTNWLETCKKVEKELISNEQKSDKSLLEIKNMYDSILNKGIIMCLLGYSTIKRENLTNKITAFDRFNAYHEFYTNGITRKFTKADIEDLMQQRFQNLQEKKKASSVKRDLNQWNADKAINLNMVNEIANQIKKSYINRLKKRRKQLTLKYGSPTVILSNEKLINRYLNRNKYNYTGLIYKIIDKITDKYYYGLTTRTLKKRWSGHLKNKKRYRLNPNSLDFFIFNLRMDLLNQGYSQSESYSILNERFIKIPIEVCFDLYTLVQREQFYISYAKENEPDKCFNIAPGGGGINWIDHIPLGDLLIGLAKGHSLNTISNNLYVSISCISKRINDFWGGYYKALDLFLKPLVEQLIKKGYDRKYISAALGGEENRQNDYEHNSFRLTSQTLTKYCCKRWWTDCNNWDEVQELLLKDIFASYVLKGYNYKKIANEMEGFHNYQQVKFRMSKLFNDKRSRGLQAARRILLKPLLLKLLPEYNDEEIVEQLNLKSWLPFGKTDHKITDEKRLLYYFIENIWFYDKILKNKGLSYEQRVIRIYNGINVSDIIRASLNEGSLQFLPP